MPAKAGIPFFALGSGSPLSRGRAGPGLARALDRDEAFAATGAHTAARRHRTGDLVALDLAERLRQRERLRLAKGGADGRATAPPIGKAAVDAIAVRMVGDDEDAVFGDRGRAQGQRRRKRYSQARQCPHLPAPKLIDRPQPTGADVESSLTLQVQALSGRRG